MSDQEQSWRCAQAAAAGEQGRPATTGGKLAQRSIRDFFSPPAKVRLPRKVLAQALPMARWPTAMCMQRMTHQGDCTWSHQAGVTCKRICV